MPKDASHWEYPTGLGEAIYPSRQVARQLRRATVVGIPSRLRHEYIPSSYMPSLSANGHSGGFRPRIKVEEPAIKTEPEDDPVPGQYAAEQSVRLISPEVTGRVVPKAETDEDGLDGMDAGVSAVEHDLSRLHLHNHGSAGGRRDVNDDQERFRLEHAIETIDTLRRRIYKLERTEQRLKKQLSDEKERLKNCKAEADGTMNLLVLAEEKICEAEGLATGLKTDMDRYRRWWLTEYYSIKALIVTIPPGPRDGAHHIMEAAHARFEAFSSL